MTTTPTLAIVGASLAGAKAAAAVVRELIGDAEAVLRRAAVDRREHGR